jgi:flagellar basal-body rod modification protein FlgD
MSEIDLSGLPSELLQRPPGAAPPADGELGQEEFFKLMIAQLNNQDPFEPLESGQFLAQIAQFGTVSGIQKLQETMTGLSASITADRSFRAAALLDREVLVDSSTAVLRPEEGLSAAIELQQAVGGVTVEILNGAGARVAAVNLGSRPAGITDIRWNGLDSEGNPFPSGEYRLRAIAQTGSGNTEVSTLGRFAVAGVSISPDGGELRLDLEGGRTVGMDDIRRID